jgi:hypothetical protein
MYEAAPEVSLRPYILINGIFNDIKNFLILSLNGAAPKYKVSTLSNPNSFFILLSTKIFAKL